MQARLAQWQTTTTMRLIQLSHRLITPHASAAPFIIQSCAPRLRHQPSCLFSSTSSVTKPSTTTKSTPERSNQKSQTTPFPPTTNPAVTPIPKLSKSSWPPLKGMHDYSPPQVARHRTLETLFAQVCSTFTYAECRTPLLERADLFQRSLGETSDVVAKEMFLFDDHGTTTVLRPEATASVARSLLAAGIGSLPLPTRLYYSGPMFRRERPQAGRQRQFAQFGVECVGSSEVDADVEVIQAAAECLRRIDLLPYVTLQINSLGDTASRAAYIKALEEFLRRHQSELSDDSRARLERGSVLRILDSKDANDQAILLGTAPGSTPAPILLDYLNPPSAARFEALKQRLTEAGVAYEFNPFLVRGLDYYQHACFEFVLNTKKLRTRFEALGLKDQRVPAQSTVLAGGRYDGLYETLGGPSIPAVGWAAGLDRLILLQDMVQATSFRLPLPTPIGVILIQDDTTSPSTTSTTPPSASPSTNSTLPSVSASHAALCTYIRRGCQTTPSTSASSTTASSSSTLAITHVLPSHAPYSVVRSFNSSMTKQFKYCSRSGLLDFGPSTPQVPLVILIGASEVEKNEVKIKRLKDGEQFTVPLGELKAKLDELTNTTSTNNTNQPITYDQLIRTIQAS